MKITINSSQGSFDRPVIRVFSLKDGSLIILTGMEFSDHDVWIAKNGNIALIGIFSPEIYKKTRKTKILSISVNSLNFDYINDGNKAFLTKLMSTTFEGTVSRVENVLPHQLVESVEYESACRPASI